MARVREAFYKYLTGVSDIQSKLGDGSTAASVRLFPMRAPAGTALPYATFQRISHSHQHHQRGGAGQGSALLQVDVWAADGETAATVSESLREALQGSTRATWASGTTYALQVQAVFLQGERDSEELVGDGSESFLYHTSMDFEIIHVETMPVWR